MDVICEACGGDIGGGVCRNCGTPAPGALPATEPPTPGDDLQDLPPDLALAPPGLAALIQAAGDDPARPELQGSADRAVFTLLSLTGGIDQDPASLFEPSATIETVSGVTLSASVPMRTACERCMLPVFGEIRMRCEPRDRPLDGWHLARLAAVLMARYQTEAQIAEQIAAGLVSLGGAGSASVRVTARRPCDECGAGRIVTTARARRTAPVGGDPQQEEGG